MRRLLGVGIIVTLAACGGGGSAGPNDTIAPSVADQLKADAAVLQPGDLPGSFRRASSSTSYSADASESVSGVADECFPTNDAKTASSVREFVDGPDIRHTIVRGEVETHADAPSLTGKLPAFTSASASACMKQFIGRLFAAQGGVVGDVSAVPSNVDAQFDEQVGFVFSVPVSQVESFTIGIEIVLGRIDRFRSTVIVVAFDKPPNHSYAADAMKAMGHRVRQ